MSIIASILQITFKSHIAIIQKLYEAIKCDILKVLIKNI